MGLNPGPEKWLKRADELNPFGYYECFPLLQLSREIISKLGGDFLRNIPQPPPGWLNQMENEKQQILNIVKEGNVEIFKDAPMLIIADLYDELFPDASWIVIHRDIRETYKSRSHDRIPHVSFEEWEKITETRMSRWRQTRPFSKALNVDYKDFSTDLPGTIKKISTFLGIQLSEGQIKDCMDFFKPGCRKKM